MCALFGSFDKAKLLELHKLNSYRGELSYSLGVFETAPTNIQMLMKDTGEMPRVLVESLALDNNQFVIGHTQAPTQQSENVHPAVYEKSFLWHNGIIKQNTLGGYNWDTYFMLSRICDYGWSVLSRIDGTFACIMYHENKLHLFRNEISPLFVDDDLNFSSTKFEGSRALEPNIVFEMDLKYKRLYNIATFTTYENPYYFPDEVKQ